jgi:DNA-binding response OmpR family regulator
VIVEPSRNNKTVLIVEDDDAAAQLLREILEEDGFQVLNVRTGSEAERLLRSSPWVPDLVVLDLVLPDMDGLVLLAQIRARFDTPVIVCTASLRKRDAVLSLRLGADDVIIKPFDLEELEARIAAVMRRAAVPAADSRERSHRQPSHIQPVARSTHLGFSASTEPEVHTMGNLTIDDRRRTASLGGRRIDLTPTEYRLLRALSSHADEVLTRRDLGRLIWGHENVSAGRTIDVHIRRLRVKLNASDVPAPLILSVRGEGYRLIPYLSSGLSA